MGERAALAILAKAPIPGYAKTRLAPRLGPGGAAALHALLLDRTLAVALRAGFDEVALWCAPDRAAFGAVALPPGVRLRDQPPGDLGARMLGIASVQLGAARAVVLAGADCPELSPGHLAALRAAVAEGDDAALLPARDGGYAALALARADRALFDGVPWSTASVLAATRERLRALGWRWRELAAVRDVDEPADVEWLLASGLLDARERARLAPWLAR